MVSVRFLHIKNGTCCENQREGEKWVPVAGIRFVLIRGFSFDHAQSFSLILQELYILTHS